MSKRVASGIILTLLMLSILTLVFNVQPAKAEPRTWIVDDDGPADFHTIQEAIDAANPGDTVYVRAGIYCENVIVSKTISIIGEDNVKTVIDGRKGSYVIQIVNNNVTISGFYIKNGTWGIFAESRNSTIEDNKVLDCTYAIFVSGSGNKIRRNLITNVSRGIQIWYCDNSVVNNEIIGNQTQFTIGVGLTSGGYTKCEGNEVIGNNVTGFWTAISLYTSMSDRPIYDNHIYHNNFVNYTENVNFFRAVFNNFWDDGYPSGGNYWSDYTGVDLYSGPYQNETGSDGIGDSPYVIKADNRDRYPLMSFYGVVPIYPIAAFNYSPSNPIACQTSVVFDASDSVCPNGTITTYLWNFDDGTLGIGEVASHIYNSYGSYNVTLTVVSNTGSRNSQTQLVTVRDSPIPSFAFSPAFNLSVGQPVTFNASLSNPRGGIITAYVWDFGDANTTLTIDPTIVHVYAFQGAFNVTLTVSDSEGLNSSCFQTIPVMMPTFVSVSTSSSSTFVGFTVYINGTLHDIYGNGLEDEPVVLYYTFPGATTWFPISSGITDNLGHYYVQWIPPATGYFTIKTEWAGNTTHFGASNTTTLSSILYQNQYVFTVESNSTISSLAFNTTGWELSFTASGPNGTRGYVKVTVAKSLVFNITNIRAYLDGVQIEHSITSRDDSWLLTFSYTHSTHQVTVDLDITIVPEFPSAIILPLFIILTMFTIVVRKRKFSRRG